MTQDEQEQVAAEAWAIADKEHKEAVKAGLRRSGRRGECLRSPEDS